MDVQTRRAERFWPLFVVISLYLCAVLAWRVFTRAGEWPSPTVLYLSMGFDLLLVVSAIGLGIRIGEADQMERRARPLWVPLMVAASIAGIGMFAIRFSSSVGWWTGHLRNWTD